MFSSIIQRYAKDKMKRWRLFHVTDFQTLMHLCFTFHRILGIFPYKINASIFEASKPHYIISTVIVCACFVFDVVFVQAIINSRIDLGDIPRKLEITCFNTFSGFIVIVTYVLSGPRMRVLQTILEISSKLSSESYQKLSRLIHVKDILCTTFLVVQICISFFRMFFVDELDYLMVLTLIFEAYFYIVVFQINMLYINCLCVLKACYKSINDNLVHMQILMANNIKLYNLRLIHHVQRGEFLLIELKILKKWHLMVSDTIKTLNAIFSLQLLAIIAMSFSNITFQVYFYVVHWQDGISINFDIHFIGPFARAIVYYILNTTLLVWACETSKKQAQEISTTIHDVLNNTNNELIKNELQLFSVQILHRENTFSVKGLTVDATLLTAIVGNITTYLIILIQFLSASHSCDRMNAIQPN